MLWLLKCEFGVARYAVLLAAVGVGMEVEVGVQVQSVTGKPGNPCGLREGLLVLFTC